MHATTAELFRAALGDDVVRLVEALEHEDVDVLARDQNLQTPLMFAAAAGSLECAEYLVDFGADFTLEDARGDTAFDLAVAAWGERHPDHPLLLYFKSLGAPRGRGQGALLSSGCCRTSQYVGLRSFFSSLATCCLTLAHRWSLVADSTDRRWIRYPHCCAHIVARGVLVRVARRGPSIWECIPRYWGASVNGECIPTLPEQILLGVHWPLDFG
mmetsp:Transcript_87116/g.281295  ORF Transcript_87116/g.281295 Transcript_87116/m.281295 type:complete len:214 (+) Transcript_87116:3508-4149(+)